MGWMILLAFLGGASGTFSKIALEVFPVYTYTFLRFVIAGIVLIPLFAKSKEKISKRDIPKFVLISLLATANVTLFSFGIRYTTVFVSQLMYSMTPIFVAIGSVLILKSRISKLKICGIIIGFLGMTIIIIIPNLNEDFKNFGTIIGNLLVLTAVISNSVYTVLSKRLQKSFAPLSVTTMMVITTIMATAILAPIDISNYSNIVSNISAISVIALLYVAIGGTAIYYLLYQRVIKKVNPLAASTTFYLQPLCAYIIAFVLIGEKLNLTVVFGSVFILFGAWLVNYNKEKAKE